MNILVLNGPNLNLLGGREPEIYGRQSYADLVRFIQEAGVEADVEVECRQTNHEGVLIDWIQEAPERFQAILINPAAYTHTSVALLDSLKAIALPAVEVHLSDTRQREDFRRISYAGQACLKTFQGLGFEGYAQGILWLKAYLQP